LKKRFAPAPGDGARKEKLRQLSGKGLQGFSWAGSYKDLLIALVVILCNDVDKPDLFKLTASEKVV